MEKTLVSGTVHDKAARDRLLRGFRKVAQNQILSGTVKVDSAFLPATWLEDGETNVDERTVSDAIPILLRDLREGSFRVSDLEMVLEGTVPDPAAKFALSEQIGRVRPEAVFFRNKLEVRDANKPGLFLSTLDGKLRVQGVAPDKSIRDQVMQAVKLAWGEDKVEDSEFVVRETEEEAAWMSERLQLLPDLIRLIKNGSLEFAQDRFVIRGRSNQWGDKQAIVSQLERAKLSFPVRNEYEYWPHVSKDFKNALFDLKIYFDNDSSELGLEEKSKIETVLQHLFQPQHKEVSLVAAGYASASGGAERNRELSEQRAKAVADALVKSGVDPKRLSMQSYGATNLQGNQDTEEGQRSSRRVEIHIKR